MKPADVRREWLRRLLSLRHCELIVLRFDARLGLLIDVLDSVGMVSRGFSPEHRINDEAELRTTLTRINAALAVRSLPPHREPEHQRELPERVRRQRPLLVRLNATNALAMHLRDIIRHLWVDGSLPLPNQINYKAEVFYDEERNEGAGAPGWAFDHLVYCFHRSGCFLPTTFAPVLSLEEMAPSNLNSIGSASQLLDESRLLSLLFQNPADDSAFDRQLLRDNPRLAQWDGKRIEHPAAFAKVRILCEQLTKAAKLSMESGCAIFFG
jgi:hypothetical protein